MKPLRWIEPDRLWAKVDRTGGVAACWLWLGGLNQGRYGLNSPHRRAYEVLVGPIPTGLTIDHLCFEPRCCNPGHMEPVTLAENLRRQRKAFATHCARDHAFDDANTYRTPAGHRTCRACRNRASNKYKARLRVAA